MAIGRRFERWWSRLRSHKPSKSRRRVLVIRRNASWNVSIVGGPRERANRGFGDLRPSPVKKSAPIRDPLDDAEPAIGATRLRVCVLAWPLRHVSPLSAQCLRNAHGLFGRGICPRFFDGSGSRHRRVGVECPLRLPNWLEPKSHKPLAWQLHIGYEPSKIPLMYFSIFV